jgi:hypothetical protein
MMLDSLSPRTKNDLVRAIQKMPVKKIQIIDGYVAADERDLLKAAKDMAAGNHDLTIILVRS